jgi:hypothetical protein
MIKTIKKTLKDAGGTIKAPFAIAKANRSIARDNAVVPVLKLANATKNIDTSDMDQRDPIFRARATMSNYQSEYAKRRANSNK